MDGFAEHEQCALVHEWWGDRQQSDHSCWRLQRLDHGGHCRDGERWWRLWNADGDAHSYTHTDGHTNSHSYGDANRDAHADANSHGHGNSYGHGDSDIYADTDAYSHAQTYPDAQAAADASSAGVALSGPLIAGNSRDSAREFLRLRRIDCLLRRSSCEGRISLGSP